VYLYETHLSVADTAASQAFYTRVVGLKFAHRDLTRDIIFLWAGDDRRSMLGLWGPTTTYGRDFHRSHVAFAISLAELLAVGERLRGSGALARISKVSKRTSHQSSAGCRLLSSTFATQNGHSVEFIALLDGTPDPSFIGPLSEWRKKT
jgi:lactoylglutathione lyase